MTRDTLKLTTLAALILAVPTLSFAQFSTGDTLGMSEAEIRSALNAKGATIEEVETEDGLIEVEYMLENIEYEVTVDPASGKIVEIEQEEEDGEDDDDHDDA